MGKVLKARKESSLRGDGSLDVRDRLGSGGELGEGQGAQLLRRMEMLVQDPLRYRTGLAATPVRLLEGDRAVTGRLNADQL